MGFRERLGLLVILSGALPAQQPAKSTEGPQPRPAFMDVTSALGVDFQYMASHTPRHYLPQTMGAGVALFDYDKDGRLDLFLVNGAPIKDPATKGTILQKTGPNYSFASTAAQNRRVASAAGLRRWVLSISPHD